MAVFSVKVPTMVGVPGKYGKLKEPNPPKTVAPADAILAGTSTVMQLARGSIANTSIALSNADIWHICDPKSRVALFLATKNSELKISGIDMSSNMIELAQRNNPSAQFLEMDIREISSLKNEYNGIICGFCMPYLSQSGLVICS